MRNVYQQLRLCISKIGKVGVRVCIIVLLLEVLVGAELTEKSKEHVQRLYHRLLILQLVHWNVTHCADNLRIVLYMHIDFRSRERCRLEGLFHFRVPFLH